MASRADRGFSGVFLRRRLPDAPDKLALWAQTVSVPSGAMLRKRRKIPNACQGSPSSPRLYQNRIHSICRESDFVRKSKKNEFELFWGNETGGGGKVGRDVSEAFGFLSR